MGNPSASEHPCLSCGACCAYFRVSFYWREAEPGDHSPTVPKELTEDTGGFFRAMKGTAEKKPRRCIALNGRVGERVHCGIYANRSTTCRNFEASFENGTKNPRCDEAREAYGLRPLTPRDWGRSPPALRQPEEASSLP